MDNQTKWSSLLKAAITQPGLVLKAYSAFHGYSLGNQLAAMMQCHLREISPGPINTYQGWKKLGRQVRKGEKAIWLCMPLARKKKADNGEDQEFILGFNWCPHWFVLSQTDGEPFPMPAISGWDKARALSVLKIAEAEFQMIDGNTMGYAIKRQVAVSPLCPLPH